LQRLDEQRSNPGTPGPTLQRQDAAETASGKAAAAAEDMRLLKEILARL
jgi:hypothetical protein